MAGRVLRGVVFDMDGTLTVPCIDFVEMRKRVGVPTGDLLKVIDTWQPVERQQAYDIIKEMELEALDKLKIMPGARALCEFLDSKNIRRGLITRNVRASVDHFHRAFGMKDFQPALSREFEPYKPDPGPLIHICSVWGVHPSDVLMVGDSPKDDILCGRRAGAMTCLIDWLKNFPEVLALPEEHRPDFRTETLMEVKALLEEKFQLEPALPPLLTSLIKPPSSNESGPELKPTTTAEYAKGSHPVNVSTGTI
eukprot:TRINITY_DN16171_c0_g1_i1.p1 TRINITY_DN16171_c0_g1~~TRINITY_DN16171_c0_g1_i1.p1  ORF type:complete len:284 (-),score=19.63 TRINITY_DN16171_c0_g1_i1:207-962(-)